MADSDDAMDIFLQPGEMFFGDTQTRIRTLLGSCIAISMWHPIRRVGGMAHCLLPTADFDRRSMTPDARYVDDAILMLFREAMRERLNPAEFQYKLFGGADMFAGLGATSKVKIGEKNAAMAYRMLDMMGIAVVAHDLGGNVHRSVIFDVDSGHVWIRTGEPETLAALDREIAL